MPLTGKLKRHVPADKAAAAENKMTLAQNLAANCANGGTKRPPLGNNKLLFIFLIAPTLPHLGVSFQTVAHILWATAFGFYKVGLISVRLSNAFYHHKMLVPQSFTVADLRN